MNDRFVAVSTVMGSRIRGCFCKPRCDFIVTRGWQILLNLVALRPVRSKCLKIDLQRVWKKETKMFFVISFLQLGRVG